jgi:hypothetical protein
MSCSGAETLEVLLKNEYDNMTIKHKQQVIRETATFTTVT